MSFALPIGITKITVVTIVLHSETLTVTNKLLVEYEVVSLL